MELGRKPARITSISFGEGLNEVGAEFIFWGCNKISGSSCVQGSYVQLAHGTPQSLSIKASSNGKTFNVYGLTASKCALDTSGCCDGYYATINDFRFTADNSPFR